MPRRLPDNVLWFDERLPFIEARSVTDGRLNRYDRHSHDTFSIGIITSGQSTYLNGRRQEEVGAGTTTIMNPGDVHACNPARDGAWSYRVFHVDAVWLEALQRENGGSQGTGFGGFPQTSSSDPGIHHAIHRLFDVLVAEDSDLLCKEEAALSCVAILQARLGQRVVAGKIDQDGLARAAEYLSENWSESLRLGDVCRACGLSPSYLIRAFQRRYGITPHAYLVNRRIQIARERLKCGAPIAEVAIETGFFDQAHFQKTFRRLVSATPNQYRQAALASRATA